MRAFGFVTGVVWSTCLLDNAVALGCSPLHLVGVEAQQEAGRDGLVTGGAEGLLRAVAGLGTCGLRHPGDGDRPPLAEGLDDFQALSSRPAS